MKWYQWFTYCIRNKYADFNGRARRAEYWSFALMNFIIYCVIQILAHISGNLGRGVFSLLALIFCLGVLIPGIAVGVRRLHDIGASGLWILIGFIPVVNLVLIYFFAKDGESGSNRFGPSPKYDE